MADQHKHEHSPGEIVRGAMGVDLEKAAGTPDADQVPVSQGNTDVDSGAPNPTQQEVAEQTRMQQDQRPDGRSRDDRLINAGRGQHTSGRLGGVE